MIAIQITSSNNYKSMPWKNGLGQTLEIKRYDDSDGQRFRISKASVEEDGVFSDFTGQHRTLVLLSGDGMILEHKNAQTDSSHQLQNPLDIARFSGADKTNAILKNKTPIDDLNIMVRAKDTHANVTAINAIEVLKPTNSLSILFSAYYANCDCTISVNNNADQDEIVSLDKGSFLCFKAPLALIDKTLTLTKGSGVFIEVLAKSS